MDVSQRQSVAFQNHLWAATRQGASQRPELFTATLAGGLHHGVQTRDWRQHHQPEDATPCMQGQQATARVVTDGRQPNACQHSAKPLSHLTLQVCCTWNSNTERVLDKPISLQQAEATTCGTNRVSVCERRALWFRSTKNKQPGRHSARADAVGWNGSVMTQAGWGGCPAGVSAHSEPRLAAPTQCKAGRMVHEHKMQMQGVYSP